MVLLLRAGALFTGSAARARGQIRVNTANDRANYDRGGVPSSELVVIVSIQ